MFQESKYILHLNRRVRTPFGYQRVEEVHKTLPLPALKIFHERGEIVVALNHTFIVNSKEIQAHELEVGDFLETKFGSTKVTKIEEHPEIEFYDITLDQSEFENYWYYTNGVLSHNSGKSITVATYLAWQFNFFKNRNIGIVANRAAQAREFLKNTKDIISRLPIWIQQGITIWNKTDIENELKMRILTDVPSGDAFRGFSVHCVIVDECIHGDEIITIRNKKKGEIFETTIGEFFSKFGSTKIAFTSDFEVLTSNGFKKFQGIKQVQNSGLLIETSDGSIQVTKDHKFFNSGEFIKASDLKVGDTLNSKVILKITECPEIENYYDLLEVADGHHYTTSGFESSNCAFINPNDWEEFADAIFPSQSGLAWKKNIIISTAKGLNHFYDIVQKAKLSTMDPDGQSTLVEVAWDEVPRYNSKNELIPPEEFRASIIKRFGRVYFEQNYGNSFVGSSDTLVSPEILSELKSTSPYEVWDDMLNVYEPVDPEHVYIMGVDAAKDGKDFFAVQVIDVSEFPFKQAATAKLQVDYLSMPEYLYEWGAKFNTAHMIIENNEGAGQSIADILNEHLEYPNLFFKDDKRRYPGFRTTKASRDSIIRMLQILMNSAKLLIRDKDTIAEFQKFELVNDKYQASSGHDDLIMALAISLAPITDMDNFNDFGNFLRALKTDEKLDSFDFLAIDDLAFEDF